MEQDTQAARPAQQEVSMFRSAAVLLAELMRARTEIRRLADACLEVATTSPSREAKHLQDSAQQAIQFLKE